MENENTVTSMSDIRMLLEEQGKAFEAFKSSQNQKYEALERDFMNFAVKANRPGAPGRESLSGEQKQALVDFMRTGDTTNMKVESKAATVGSDPSGGYMVPQQIDSTIDFIRQQNTPMRRICRVLKPETPDYKKLVSTGGTSSGWVGEIDERSETDTSQIAVLTPAWGGLYANPAASQDLIEDSAFDIAEWFQGEVAREFSDQEGEAFITGSGVKRPRGITTFPMSTDRDSVRDFGTIQYIASGLAGKLPASFDKFFDMIYALKPKYRKNARWSTNSLTIAELRKYKDGSGRYLWQDSLIFGQPATFMGYPVEEDDFMPDVAADAYPIMFGDFQAAYWIFDRPTTVLRDPYSKKPYTLFYTATRVGSMLANSEALKMLKAAAN
ncbi:MAG: phage major capsid protein [Syntrophobacter sp.]